MTLPKKLAEKKGIKPGDTVIFEESEDAIVLRKSSSNNRKEDFDDVRRAIKAYSRDIPKIRKAVKLAESALIENLSRHLNSK